MTSQNRRFHGFWFSVVSTDLSWSIHLIESSLPYDQELTLTKGLLALGCSNFCEQLLLLFSLKANWPMYR